METLPWLRSTPAAAARPSFAAAALRAVRTLWKVTTLAAVVAVAWTTGVVFYFGATIDVLVNAIVLGAAFFVATVYAFRSGTDWSDPTEDA